MNDDFLYRLRTPPRASFAAKLKARLDFQATLVAAKRRAMRWYVFIGILLGASAVAAVLPAARTTVASWLDVESRVEAIPAVAHVDDPVVAPRARTTSAAAPAAGQSFPPASDASLVSSPAPASNNPIGLVVVTDTEIARGAVNALIADFEETYGYSVKPQFTVADKACSSPNYDVIVTLGRLSDGDRAFCDQRGTRLIESTIAYEAYVAIVHRENTWVDALKREDLRVLEQSPFDTLSTWNQVRSSWPSLPITLVGIDATYRTQSEYFDPRRAGPGSMIKVRKDDADVSNAVSSTATYGALGFMTYSTFRSQTEATRSNDLKLARAGKQGSVPTVRVLGVVNRQGNVVMPSLKTISDGSYDTLSRPLLLHVRADRLGREGVLLFGTHAVEGTSQLLGEHGFTPIDEKVMDENARKLRAASTGRR